VGPGLLLANRIFEEDYSSIGEEVSMTEQLFLIGEVSRRLDVKPHRIAYLYITRKLPEPELRLGNRRVFTEADVKLIAEALGKKEGR
jgi:hypothetical protein